MSGLAGRSAAIADPARTHVSAAPATDDRFIVRPPAYSEAWEGSSARDDVRSSTKQRTRVTDRNNAFGCDIFIGESPPNGGEGAGVASASVLRAEEKSTAMLGVAWVFGEIARW